MTAPDAWQPDFFKPKRRPKKPPPALEVRTHIAIVLAIKATRLNPGWVWFHPANGEYRSKATAALLQRMGVLPGVPDFLMFGPPAATLHGFELKRRGEVPTAAQYEFASALEAAGGRWAWGDSFEAAIKQFQAWGALPLRIKPQ